jgi:hypothetical protein
MLGFPKMHAMPQEEQLDFPAAGSRARAFKRFERDLAAWLGTPEGRFAVWDARAAIEADEHAADQA